MTYGDKVKIAGNIGDLLVTMTGKTLSPSEQDDLYKDTFEHTLQMLSRFTTDVIESMSDSLENWNELLELIKER